MIVDFLASSRSYVWETTPVFGKPEILCKRLHLVHLVWEITPVSISVRLSAAEPLLSKLVIDLAHFSV